MNGLGFRPLRYQDGTGQQGVETPGMTYENAMEYIRWIHGEGSGNLPPVEQMSKNSLAQAMAAWLDNPEAAISYATRLKNLVDSGNLGRDYGDDRISNFDLQQLRQLGNFKESIVDPVTRGAPADLLGLDYGDNRLSNADVRSLIDNANDAYSPYNLEKTLKEFGATASADASQGFLPGSGGMVKDFETTRSGPPYPYQSGGHVQRMAHGGYSSRGTVAGELPRYGNMSVREEGETMRELSKRHRDQDWYNHMSGGLGSLRRRMA